METWPDNWPFLKSLMEGGSSLTNTTAGSSPSVTPAIHANIGTGAFPKQHGIVDIPVRDGREISDSYPEKTPQYLALPTIGDLYDPTTANVAEVGLSRLQGLASRDAGSRCIHGGRGPRSGGPDQQSGHRRGRQRELVRTALLSSGPAEPRVHQRRDRRGRRQARRPLARTRRPRGRLRPAPRDAGLHPVPDRP